MIKKLIIAGGRDFTDTNLLHQAICELGNNNLLDPEAELVCGMAKGADLLGYDYFMACGNTIHKFIPDWDGLGKRAGFVRNAEMGDFCDGALIFWDQKSKGTKHMINYMIKLGKPHYVVHY